MMQPASKSAPRHYEIITIGKYEVSFKGWPRPDLDAEHPNWHYYESVFGELVHFRSEHMVAVWEKAADEDE